MKINYEYAIKKRLLRGLLSRFAYKVTHTKISGAYVIKKRWLRTNLVQPTHTKISGECAIKKNFDEMFGQGIR